MKGDGIANEEWMFTTKNVIDRVVKAMNQLWLREFHQKAEQRYKSSFIKNGCR